jgi:hypothetical protein
MNQLLDVLETVMAWELPDEYLADALVDQTRLMAGDDPEDTWKHHSDIHFPSHH